MAAVRLLAVLLAVVVAAGCGVSKDVAKQAEHVGSIAAEGSLLARDVKEGDSTAIFARVHAGALREKLAPLQDAVEHGELARVVRAVDEQLAALESAGSTEAAGIEQRLDKAAKQAEEIGKAAS